MDKLRVVALTGSGISLSAGIPTFEGQWKEKPIREYLTRKFADNHPEEFEEMLAAAWEICLAAEPTIAHKVLAEAKVPIITQNVMGYTKERDQPR